MPHFIIDCSEQIIKLETPEKIMQKVYVTADSTGLFLPEEKKVRINPFQYYTIGNNDDYSYTYLGILRKE